MALQALMIGPAEKARIDELKAFAEAQAPIDGKRVHEMVTANPKIADEIRDMMESYTISLPVGFRVTYSHEIQPSGVWRHISVSYAGGSRLPQPAVVGEILRAFAIEGPPELMDPPGDASAMAPAIQVWVEAFAREDGGDGRAVNICQRIEP